LCAGNKENVKTLPLFVGGTQGVPYVCSPAVTNLPPHGTVTAQGTVTVTNSKSGKTTTFPFSFTHSY
jgi:hypothetical protein